MYIKLKPHPSNLTDDDVTDVKFQLEDKKRKLAQEIDSATKDKRVQVAKKAYLEIKDKCIDLVSQYGNDYERNLLDKISQSEESFLNTNNPIKIREKSELLEIDRKFLSRSLNEGFSGGEKKRNEIFQMAMLEPKLAILDETDSGLDIDALRIVANGVNKLKSKDNAVIVITHYQRLLDYIVPDFVHVLHDGKIVKTGDASLALELEAKGYDWIKKELV